MKGVISFPHSCIVCRDQKVTQETCILEPIVDEFECSLSFTIRISVRMFEDIWFADFSEDKLVMINTDGGSCVHLE